MVTNGIGGRRVSSEAAQLRDRLAAGGTAYYKATETGYVMSNSLRSRERRPPCRHGGLRGRKFGGTAGHAALHQNRCCGTAASAIFA
jgi:hypothetical protein